MTWQGIEPSSDRLARVCGIPGRKAEALLSMEKLWQEFEIIARVSQSLRVRMIWLTTGRTIPAVTEIFKPEHLTALEIVDSLPSEQVALWLAQGRRMAANVTPLRPARQNGTRRSRRL